MSKKKKKQQNDFFTTSVKVNGSDKIALEIALRKFKKMVKDSGILLEFRERQEYLKPSVKKRKMKIQAIRREKIELNEDLEEL